MSESEIVYDLEDMVELEQNSIPARIQRLRQAVALMFSEVFGRIAEFLYWLTDCFQDAHEWLAAKTYGHDRKEKRDDE